MAKTSYLHKILLISVDIDAPEALLEEITVQAYQNNHTVVCGFTAAEVARYIELLCSLSSYDSTQTSDKLVSYLQKKVDQDDTEAVIRNAMSHVKTLNKTNVKTLFIEHDSFADMCNASVAELTRIKGMGSVRATALYDMLHEPFHRSKSDGGNKSKNTGSSSSSSSDI